MGMGVGDSESCSEKDIKGDEESVTDTDTVSVKEGVGKVE